MDEYLKQMEDRIMARLGEQLKDQGNKHTEGAYKMVRRDGLPRAGIS